MTIKGILISISFSIITLMGSEPNPYRAGIGTYISNPTGTLKKAFASSSGLGASAFLKYDLGKGLGYIWDISSDTNFSNQTLPSPGGGTVNAKFTSSGTAIAFTYHPNKQQTGFYLLAGFGARRFQGTADLPSGTPEPLSKAGFGGNAMSTYFACDTGIKLAYLAGVGYDFNPKWGVVVRFQGITSIGHTLATIESGINFHF